MHLVVHHCFSALSSPVPSLSFHLPRSFGFAVLAVAFSRGRTTTARHKHLFAFPISELRIQRVTFRMDFLPAQARTKDTGGLCSDSKSQPILIIIMISRTTRQRRSRDQERPRRSQMPDRCMCKGCSGDKSREHTQLQRGQSLLRAAKPKERVT